MRFSRRALLATAAAAGVSGCIRSDGKTGADYDPPEPESGATSSRTESTTENLDGGPGIGIPVETFDEPYRTARSEWSYDGSGSIGHTTDTVYLGDRSLEVANTGGRVSWTPSSPVDLAGYHFSLAVKLPPGTSPRGQLRLRLDDIHGNTVSYTNTHSPTSPVDERWSRIDFGLPGIDVGETDLSAVEQVQIVMYDQPATIYLDDLRAVERPEKAYLILEMDNPEGDDEDWFFDLFNRHGLPFTAGIDAVNAASADNVTLDRLLDAERRGHEITSKPLSSVIERATGVNEADFEPLSADEQRAAMELNKQLLEDAGFERGVQTVVYTRNNFDAATLEVADDLHTFGRTGGYGAYSPSLTAPFALPGDVAEPPDSETKDRLDRIVDENLVYHLYWHNRNVTEAEIDRFLTYVSEYVDAGELEVVTYRDLERMRFEDGPS